MHFAIASKAHGAVKLLAMNDENKKSFAELWKFILITLVIVLPLRWYVAKPFIVEGPSMDPTFASGQYLIVDQLSYRFAKPHRGDVVVFEYPLDPSKYFIKRIIGLPGETVKMDYGKVQIIPRGSTEAITINEPYVVNTSVDSSVHTLNDHEYFVMGDNRPASSDSRAWGNLDEKYIVGRPLVRLYPLTQLSLLPGGYTLPEGFTK
jgi:signal peptidase I